MILGIDTSLGTAVAVVEDDGLVRSEASSESPLGHAEVIGTLLQTALTDAALGAVGQTSAPSPFELTHVAAGMGPGPFTGLRIGIAAARAFALGRGIPVVPVVSHDAIALGRLMLDDEAPRFAVVTDARRREFAYSVYDGVDDDGLPVRSSEPALVPRNGIDAVLAGHGAERHDATAVSAAMLALVAARSLAAGRVSVMTEPLYLRAPDVTPPAARKRVGT
ncbi:tRNA (adenosine(37)-N6)-threonylcarbamoyltransferase complex dimerization subunit type 1 TsaB [Planococcus sp. APC 4015]|nr:tRNA (adenosine(37)-N6)-threonylcarbamoyltransferase complex dimerization subunit type 1 TsaB [Planococcus sp. APC 4015]